MPSSVHFGVFLLELNQVIAVIKVLNIWKHLFCTSRSQCLFYFSRLAPAEGNSTFAFFFYSRLLTILMYAVAISLVVKNPVSGSTMINTLLM